MTSDSGALSPSDVTNVSFEHKRRGYDPDAVNAHLRAAAATVSGLQSQLAELSEKVDHLTADVASAKKEAAVAAKNPMELDEEALADRIGQDAARVLAEARSAAADRLVEAEREAEKILAGAEEVYASRSRDADQEAERIRARATIEAAERAQAAETAAAQLVSSAEADLELARSEVYSDRESADAEATRIIREAELARRQILGDLLRRRGAAKRQIEQLRAGRERLLASHESVRRALDEITEELNISMSEARAAAKTAGHSVSDGTIEELEAEIETARLTGLLDTGPVPVVRSPALPTSSSANKPPAEPAPPEVSTPVDEETDSEESGKEDVADVPVAEEIDDVKKAAADEDVADETPSTENDPADASDGNEGSDNRSGLADVVQLDSARPEVDTKTHPAKGRNVSSTRSSTPTDPEADLPSGDPSTPTEIREPLAAVVDGPVEATGSTDTGSTDTGSTDGADGLEDDDSVGDLFASLRSENDKPVPAKKKSTATKPAKSSKKTTAKKSPSKKSPKKTSAAKKPEPVEDPVDSSELARRLKRVLADEQSRAMSTVKGAEELPDLEGLLNTDSVHREPYWAEVLGQIDGPGDAGEAAGSAIDELVASIRRRVGDALVSADGDSDAAVASLRSIYREIKTQQVPETADVVCRSLLTSA